MDNALHGLKFIKHIVSGSTRSDRAAGGKRLWKHINREMRSQRRLLGFEILGLIIDIHSEKQRASCCHWLSSNQEGRELIDFSWVFHEYRAGLLCL